MAGQSIASAIRKKSTDHPAMNDLSQVHPGASWGEQFDEDASAFGKSLSDILRGFVHDDPEIKVRVRKGAKPVVDAIGNADGEDLASMVPGASIPAAGLIDDPEERAMALLLAMVPMGGLAKKGHVASKILRELRHVPEDSMSVDHRIALRQARNDLAKSQSKKDLSPMSGAVLGAIPGAAVGFGAGADVDASNGANIGNDDLPYAAIGTGIGAVLGGLGGRQLGRYAQGLRSKALDEQAAFVKMLETSPIDAATVLDQPAQALGPLKSAAVQLPGSSPVQQLRHAAAEIPASAPEQISQLRPRPLLEDAMPSHPSSVEPSNDRLSALGRALFLMSRKSGDAQPDERSALIEKIVKQLSERVEQRGELYHIGGDFANEVTPRLPVSRRPSRPYNSADDMSNVEFALMPSRKGSVSAVIRDSLGRIVSEEALKAERRAAGLDAWRKSRAAPLALAGGIGSAAYFMGGDDEAPTDELPRGKIASIMRNIAQSGGRR